MTTTPVSFPDIEGTFQTACSEVLSTFFSLGYTGTLGGMSEAREILQAEIHYNIDKVQPVALPRLCLVGTRSAELFSSKCENPSTRTPIKVKKINLRKTAYLSIPRQGPITVRTGGGSPKVFPSTWALILRSWGDFSLIFNTQKAAFKTRGILNPRLAFTPVQGSEKEFMVGIGSFDCSVEFSYQEE